jgi:chaperonin cofactor prefoldin
MTQEEKIAQLEARIAKLEEQVATLEGKNVVLETRMPRMAVEAVQAAIYNTDRA